MFAYFLCDACGGFASEYHCRCVYDGLCIYYNVFAFEYCNGVDLTCWDVCFYVRFLCFGVGSLIRYRLRLLNCLIAYDLI